MLTAANLLTLRAGIGETADRHTGSVQSFNNYQHGVSHMRGRLIGILTVVSVMSLTAGAQDAVKVSPEVNKVLVDNAHVRVVRSTFAPGQKEATHTHPAGWYIVTKGGDLKVTSADGKVTHWLAKRGEQAWMEPEGAHTAENVGKGTFEYILVEVKGAAR